MRKPVITVLAALAMTMAGAAHAKSPEAGADTVSETVTYADLNLASAAGMETLSKRIDRAASRVCDRAGSRDLASSVEFNACRDKARTEAMGQIPAETIDQLSLANPFDGLELASIF